MATLPWETGKSTTTQNSKLPWEREEDRRQQYSAVMDKFPDLHNPSKQLDSVKKTFSLSPAPTIPQATSLPSPSRMLQDQHERFRPAEPTQSRMDWVREKVQEDPAILQPISTVLRLAQAYTPLGDIQRGGSQTVPSAPGINHASNVPPAFNNGLGTKISEGAGNILGGIAQMKGAGINPVGDPLRVGAAVSSRIVNPLARRAVEGVVGGAMGGAIEPAIVGQTDAKDILRGGALGGALGGLGDTAIGLAPVLRKTAQGAAQNVVKSRIDSAFQAINEVGNISTGGLSSGIKRGATADIVYSPTLSHIVSGTRKGSSTLGAKVDQSYIDIVDDIYALRRFDQAAEKELGRTLNPSESVYQLAMASRGADQITKQSLTNKLVDIVGNVKGDSLKDSLKGIKRKDQRSFMDYLLNKHAITRFERGEKVFDTLPDGSNWTPEKGADIIQSYLSKRPEFETTEQAFREFNDNFNQTWLVDTGMLPKSVVDNWKKENPTYIDMQRQFSDLEKIGSSGIRPNSGFGGQKAPVKKYSEFGSTRKVIDPMESMIMRYDATVKAAKRNEPMKAMYNLVQTNPDAFKGLVTKVDDPPPSLNIKGLDLSNPDSLDQVLMTFGDAYEKAIRSSRKDLDNVVPVMMDGNTVYLKFGNKQLLDAVLNVNPQVLKGFMGAASKVANFQKAIYTSVNPIFTLTRSIFRDPINAFVNSKTTNNPFEFIADLATATNAVLRHKELYQEFKNIGGGYTSPNVGAPHLLNRTQRELVVSGSKLNGIAQRFGDSLLENLDKIESIVRVAEYKRARGTGKTLDERLRGLDESQEVATNFKRRGAKTKELEPIFLYLNASIQSLDKLGRAFKDQPGVTSGKIGLAITAPSLVLYAINRNDPNYQKLRDSEKDRFFHIPIGDGKFFRFPIPPELAPFSNVPRRLLDQAFGGNDDAWNDFGKTIVETVIPPGMSGSISGAAEDGIPGALFGTFRGTPIVGPSVEAFANKSWIGSPIVPGYLEKASPENQFTDTTSPLSKTIGKYSNSSPMKLDYLLTSIGGDYGKIIQEISSKGRSEGLKSVGRGLTKRLVINSEDSNKLIDQFYELKNKYDTMNADVKASGEVPKEYNDETRKALNRVSDYLSDVNKAVRMVQSSLKPKAEKEELIKKLKERRMEVAQKAYERFK